MTEHGGGERVGGHCAIDLARQEARAACLRSAFSAALRESSGTDDTRCFLSDDSSSSPDDARSSPRAAKSHSSRASGRFKNSD